MKKKQFKDKYYAPLIKELSNDVLLASGYLNEKHNNLDSQHNLYTPINYKAKEGDTILVTTGSYAPIHEGHIELIKSAQKYYTKKGFNISASYISPSHDKYVVNTKIKDKKYNIFNRFQHILNIIKDNDLHKKNIFLDMWEGIGVKEDVNFTTVIEHLKIAYKKALNINVNVIYLYGSDNIDFSYAFNHHGRSFCLNRGNLLEADIKKRQILHPNTDFVLTNSKLELSSTKIRNQKIEKNNKKNGIYFLRDDFLRSTSIFNTEEYEQSKKEIINILSKYTKKEIHIIEETKEKKSIEHLNNDNILSLDVYHFNNKIRASRIFNLFDSQIEPSDIFIKNFNKYKKQNINDIILFDDDSVSGNTFKLIENKLNIKNIKKETLINNYLIKYYPNQIVYDVVDFRDFIFASKEGGLLMLAKEDFVKFPYIFPFVNLYTRANIDYEDMIQFSLDILNINLNLYKNKNIPITKEYITICDILNIKIKNMYEFILYIKNQLEDIKT